MRVCGCVELRLCVLLCRDIVELLLNNSASLLVHDVVTKRTPLHAASGNGHKDTVQVNKVSDWGSM